MSRLNYSLAQRVLTMAHELATTNGKTAMAFRGDLPWHGLGTNMTDRADATDAEWMEESGTGFEVGLVNIYDANGNVILPDRRLMARLDTGAVFDSSILLSDHYKPFQNREALEFCRVLTNNNPSVTIETIGALFGGSSFWLLMNLGDFNIAGDEMKKYLLISNNHTGQRAFRGLATSVRVVCNNTLTLAMSNGKESGFAIRHKGNLQDNVLEAARLMGIALDGYDKFQAVGNELAAKKVKTKDVDTFLNILVPDPTGVNAKGEKPDNTNAVNERAKIKELFESGAGNDRKEIKHTLWTLLNGVTDHIGHWKNMGSKKTLTQEQRESRFTYTLMGLGDQRAQQAFNLCTTYLEKGKFPEPVPVDQTIKKPRKSRSGGVSLN